MLIQNFGVTNKEYYGMSWYFLDWSIQYTVIGNFEQPRGTMATVKSKKEEAF